MTTRKRVPETVIGARNRTKADNPDFLNMFVGFRKKPVGEWPKWQEITNGIDHKKEKNRQYFRDKKGAKRSLKT